MRPTGSPLLSSKKRLASTAGQHYQGPTPFNVPTLSTHIPRANRPGVRYFRTKCNNNPTTSTSATPVSGPTTKTTTTPTTDNNFIDAPPPTITGKILPPPPPAPITT
ncbi:unnamed protein product [Schistocephalus solidus]|uniref:Uncharacterized protein n=1 Tax=Schistocephalus solidus TaxID=70667 RepID=A0A183SP44_SCHSO|nr:unnamed protein product [Schistocephalus solidus]